MPRIVDKKEKREKILEAAISVFAKKGTAKTKTADIAEAAQIGKGTIYEYFKSKDEIMLDFWAEGIRRKEKAATFSLKNIYDENRDLLKSILDEWVSQDKIYPVNTHVVSSLILGALDGLMLQWIIDPRILGIEESLTEMETLILRGLKKEG